MANVRTLEPKITVELTDLDSCTIPEEVEAAIKSALKCPDMEIKVNVTNANNREQKTAIVQMGEHQARALLEIGRIKIGWVYSRARKRIEVPRCYRCHGYGHIAAFCQGTDRSGLCYKCGSAGHKARECDSSPKCVICIEAGQPENKVNHQPGTSRCAVFRSALENLKNAQK
ncbi:Zinc knuckle [Popillia japonica]|uniref:Zinc knuckle n=1 Tax=Popillia japonica TaxID=7064 RepID=A0AAW1I795_POPJA